MRKVNSKYDHTSIELKWQKKWASKDIYKTPTTKNKGKKYVLDMFPYPSGASMHVGHLEGYVGTDILSRFYRMQGYSVLHPMGWDAFGLPAENYAIKTGIHPQKSTHKNIETFKRQLGSCALSYDWEKEIDTSSPEFYKWTQELFILMWKRELAYKKKAAVNWCPKDETVLANEQVIDGKCERCDTPVVQKELEQWFLKITDYADPLIDGLENLDWLPEVKVQQKNWIGKSVGMKIKFDDIEVFTTRPETIEGATFVAIAGKFDPKNEEKEGRFSGKYVLNPLTKKKIPVWEVNYVDANYGSGAVMGVPYLDERDMKFAKKYHLDVLKFEPKKNDLGEKATYYHLRDWLISRQRYWGCPIPMIYCEDCNWQPVAASDLPVELPTDVDFLPKGESPIGRSKTFQKGVTCPKCGKVARREVDTMDTYVDSSWYFIRFVDPKNKSEIASAQEIKKWLPVDDYVGGGHVVQHLLFARFFWKVLFDAGLVDKSLGDEPFLKLRAPGWILGADSRKMSKRSNNVVTPDDIIPKFGADTLRVYEMFMGPFEVMKPWNITGVEGASRFLSRVWRICNQKTTINQDHEINIKMHQTIKKITEEIPEMKFNTAISSIMEYVNLLQEKDISKENLQALVLLLAPFAPHIAEEIWCEVLGNKFSVHTAAWPSYDEKLTILDTLTIPVQINGKLRSQLTVSREQSTTKSVIQSKAEADPKIVKWLEKKEIKKTVFVPGRLINFVV